MGARGSISKLKLPAALRSVPDLEDPSVAESMHTKVRPTKPEKPEDLPEEISELWDTLVDELDDAGLVSRLDGPALELALRHYLIAVLASDTLQREGVTKHDNKNDRVMKNPASQIFRDHSSAFLEFAKQLGLSFVARARVSLPESGESDDDNPFAP